MSEDFQDGLGSRIAAFRRTRGATQKDLGVKIGRSVQWVSGVEQGRLHADRLQELVDIAGVLGCEVEDLLGRPVSSLTSPGAAPGPGTSRVGPDAVAAVVLRSALPETEYEMAPEPGEIARRVARAWAMWHRSPTAHAGLAAVLPGLLADALACQQRAQGQQAPERRAAAGAASGAWQLTRQWLHRQHGGDLAWIAAERAMAAAREAEDPRLIALGAWGLSRSYRRCGQPDEAARLCLAAGDTLAPLLPDSRDPGLLAAYGMLHLTAAISAAESDQDGRAWALHRVADRAARSLGGRYDPWTAFGPTNVDIWAISIHATLGNADAVVDMAPELDLEAMPSTHRRAGVLIDVARGFARRGEDERSALVLLDAERASSDEVGHSPMVRDTVRDLLCRDRAGARPHVRGLARRIGLVAT
jgi:transcriptional regulator with XRE-family HTH domain